MKTSTKLATGTLVARTYAPGERYRVTSTIGDAVRVLPFRRSGDAEMIKLVTFNGRTFWTGADSEWIVVA